MTQVIYFALAFLNDIIGTNEVCPKKTPRIRVLKDIMFGVAFPFAFYIAIVFWICYALYKDLIFPEYIANAFPLWVNHVMHTLIIPFVVIELFITPKIYISRLLGIAIGFLIGVAYICVLLIALMVCGTMVYPFMDYMSWKVLGGFVVISYLGVLVIYLLGAELNDIIHGISKMKTEKIKTKAK